MTTLKRQAEEMAWEIKGDMGQPEEEYYELIQAFLAGAEALLKMFIDAELHGHGGSNLIEEVQRRLKDGGEQ